MTATAQAALWFRRGLRRELRLAMATLTLAAAVTSGLALFSARLERTVVVAADGALGADLVIRDHAPLPAAIAARARESGLELTRETRFPTVAVAGDQLKLASVRALDAPYPLRGNIELRRSPGSAPVTVKGVPPRGAVWASPMLAAALHLHIGGRLTLGQGKFRIGAFVVRAPGAGIDLAGIAPLLIMNRADLPATGLAGNQSRIQHELLVSGPADALKAFRQKIKGILPAGADVRDINDVNPGLRTPLTTTLDFLRLAVLATLLIAAAALIQCARYYRSRQQHSVAVLKTLGATRGRIRTIYSIETVFMAVAAGCIGALGGWGLSLLFDRLAAYWFGLDLSAASPLTLLYAPVTALLFAAGLWLVPMLGLTRTRPIRLLREGWQGLRGTTLPVVSGLITLLAVLFAFGARKPALTAWTLAAGVGLAVVVGGSGYGLMRALGAPAVSLHSAWRYGLGNLARNRARSLGELIAFGLVLCVILLLTGVRHDLIASWRAHLPRNAPDHFIVNIQPAQKQAVADFLASKTGAAPPLYPMARARLTAINGVPVSRWAQRLEDGRGQRLLDREQTLSMRARPGRGNAIIAGH